MRDLVNRLAGKENRTNYRDNRLRYGQVTATTNRDTNGTISVQLGPAGTSVVCKTLSHVRPAVNDVVVLEHAGADLIAMGIVANGTNNRDFTKVIGFTDSINNLTAVVFTNISSHNSLSITFDIPFTMIVQMAFVYGFNAANNSAGFRFLDETGSTDITWKSTILDGDYKFDMITPDKFSGAMTAKKQYAANATPGYFFQAYVTASNLWLDSSTIVTFAPGAV